MSLLRFLRRGKWDRERLAEIESYLQIETDDNIARGMSAAEARAAARRKLGNRTLIREEIYRLNTMSWLDALARDGRHGARMLRRNPGFTAVALLMLAIGIGANTAVFSVVNSILLKPLPYPKSEELVALRQAAPGAAGLANVSDGLRLSPSMYFTYAEHNRTFQALGVWIPGTATVTGFAEPEQVRTVLVSDGLLQALGVPPAMGRLLGPADQAPGAAQTVLLSYGYWRRRFGGDPAMVGRSIRVDERPREIAGIMPEGFRILDTDADLIVPIGFERSKLILAGFGYQGIARLKPGVTIAQAGADMARMLPIWMNSWSNGPGTNPRVYETWRITPDLRPLKQEVIGNVASVLWVLMATIGIVLLIACANVANLLLVRADGRQHELAVRAALGAGWARMVRELLIECISLAMVGGGLGVALAYAALRLLIATGPANLPRLNEISLDGRALAFTFVISLAAGVLFGLIPAFKYGGSGAALALRSEGRTASASRERRRARGMLIVGQVALALVLLVSSGLMLRTFAALRMVEPGFTHAAQLEMMRITIPPQLVADAKRVVQMQREIADKLAAIPGVRAAAFASSMPMEGFDTWWDEISAEDKPTPAGEIAPLRMYQFVSPGLFQTAGVKIVAGRDYTWAEIDGARPVVIISENLARELFGSGSAAIGKRIRVGRPWQEVIGVVGDVRYNGVDKPAPAVVYWPCVAKIYGEGIVARAATFVIRSTRTGTEGFLNQIQRAVWSVNPDLALASFRTMQEVYDHSLARTSFALVMLAIAGGLALVLGIVGIYGVISYNVSQRSREIGIRMALGAEQRALKRMFVRYALALAGTGVAIGLIAAAALMPLLKSLLFGISPLDPITYAVVPIVLAAAAALAGYVPARRAAVVDPVEALRSE